MTLGREIDALVAAGDDPRLLSAAVAGLLRAATPLIGRTAFVDARERLHLADPADAAARLALSAWEDAIKGDEDECRRHAREAFELATRHDSGIAYELATAALGELELGFGRPDDALPHFADLWESGSDFVKLLFAPSIVEAAVRAEERRFAEEAFAVLEEPALVARCRGLLSGEIASFERAIALHVESRNMFDAARTRLLAGETLRRARQRREARGHLRRAVEAFDKLGAASWAERARIELRGSGLTAQRNDPSALDRLTAQELQVAQLVAGGASNKEVAAQLFLSPRTIDFHLRNVFAKLGITSRMQLAWFELGRPGGFADATQLRAA